MEEINLGKYKAVNKKGKYKKDTAMDWLETQVGKNKELCQRK